jgi:hypothetical protein
MCSILHKRSLDGDGELKPALCCGVAIPAAYRARRVQVVALHAGLKYLVLSCFAVTGTYVGTDRIGPP